MVSSLLSEEQQRVTKPDPDIMFEREGFDRAAIRREFAPVNELNAGQRFVEEGDARFVSGDTDFATGPTSDGEVMGNVDLVRVAGGQQKIPRYTHGFTVDIEDTEQVEGLLQDMRDTVLELFDIEADHAFLQGLNDEAGNTIFNGVFTYLENEMPTDNIIDANSFDLSAGDLSGVPANIILQEAFDHVEGRYVQQQWDLAVAKHNVWADWNQVGTHDGAVVQSHWELVQADSNTENVGVNRRLLVPENIGLRGAPGENDLRRSISFPALTNTDAGGGTSDVMYLIPDHGGDFYELWEESEPTVRGPIMKEGFKERFEYKWRAGVVQNQNDHRLDTDRARGAIKIENVSTLF